MFGRHERETERPEYKTIRVVELFKVWKKKLSIWWSNLIISAVSILVLFTSAWLDGFQNWEPGGGGGGGRDGSSMIWWGGGALPALGPRCGGHVAYHHVITQITVSHFVSNSLYHEKITPPLHPLLAGARVRTPLVNLFQSSSVKRGVGTCVWCIFKN